MRTGMTHQTSGQWDKEYPGYQSTRDQLVRENAGAHCASGPNTQCPKL